jgi:hypothetical protein
VRPSSPLKNSRRPSAAIALVAIRVAAYLGPVAPWIGALEGHARAATMEETEPQSMLSSAWKVVIGCHDAFRPRILGLGFVGCRRRMRQKGGAPAGPEVRGPRRVGTRRAYGDGSCSRFDSRHTTACVRTQRAHVAGPGFVPDGAESEHDAQSDLQDCQGQRR